MGLQVLTFESIMDSNFDKLFCGKLRLSGAYFILIVNCSL